MDRPTRPTNERHAAHTQVFVEPHAFSPAARGLVQGIVVASDLKCARRVLAERSNTS